MNKKSFYSLPLGLYRIHWRHKGGTSLAAIGNNMHGDRWIACTNWIRVSDDSDRINILKLWKDIEKVENIETN